MSNQALAMRELTQRVSVALCLCGFVCVSLATIAAVRTQPPRATLIVVSPADDSIASGMVPLSARVDPAVVTVSRISFYVDGRLVCAPDAPPFQCEWDAGPAINEHVIRVVALLGNGERLVKSVRTRGVAYVERVDVDVVQVTAVVTDKDGRFVKGLPRQAFRVLEDDVAQQITHFAAEDVPLEVVVAVDISSSLQDSMKQVRQAVRAFLEALGETDRVTLLAFNDSIFTLARRDATAATRLRAVDRLAPWGGTALYDVVLKAVDVIGRQVGRKAIVVFTDGEDQSSRATLEAAVRAVESSDAAVYTIAQGRGRTVEGFRRILQQIAQVSGGRAITTSPERLEDAFRLVIDELSHQYLLTYPPQNPARDGGWRRIRVELSGLRHHVRARQGYRPRK